MQITITLDHVNTAFGRTPEEEFVRILEDLIEETNTFGISDGAIKDFDGVVVGQMQVEDI